MDIHKSKIYENSWQKMMRKNLLASISEKNPIALANGPLGQSNPSGLTCIAKKILDHQSASILKVADHIWLAIMQIQDLMEIRNAINEKCMQSEEEADKLLKSTNSIQKLIEHISVQEDHYIKLSESINNNTIHIVQSYLKLMKESIKVIKVIAKEVNDEMGLKLEEQNKNVEQGVVQATSIQEIKKFIISNTIQTHTEDDPLELAIRYLDHKKYDDFICIQAYLLICYRYAMSRAISSNASKGFNSKKILLKVIDKKEKASSILQEKDIENTFSLENYSEQKSISEQLGLALSVNPDFVKKIKIILLELKGISDSRKPSEDEQTDKQGEQAA